MYLRKSKKPIGRTCLTIVQGYRDENGKNKARAVRSLGYVDALEAEFDDPVAHFEEECRRMTEEAARAQAPVTVDLQQLVKQLLQRQSCIPELNWLMQPSVERILSSLRHRTYELGSRRSWPRSANACR